MSVFDGERFHPQMSEATEKHLIDLLESSSQSSYGYGGLDSGTARKTANERHGDRLSIATNYLSKEKK